MFRLLTTTVLRGIAFISLALACGAGHSAGRLFFSELAPDGHCDIDLGITSSEDSLPAIPSITLNPGQEATLWIWYRPSFRMTAADDERYPGYSYNIEASNPALSAVSHLTLNSPTFSLDNGDFTGPTRWTSRTHGTLAPPANVNLVDNALALTVASANSGLGNANAISALDGASDPDSDAFTLGKLVVRGDLAGTTGLYFRVGGSGWPVKRGGSEFSEPAQLQFGDSLQIHAGNQFSQGDLITAKLEFADVIITTVPEPSTWFMVALIIVCLIIARCRAMGMQLNKQ